MRALGPCLMLLATCRSVPLVPAAGDIRLERIGPHVLNDARAGVVYVVDSSQIAALDRATGTVRWSVGIPAPGVGLGAAGTRLVAVSERAWNKKVLTAMAVDGTSVATCELEIAAPDGANQTTVETFARGNALFAIYQTYRASPGGGIEPDDAEKRAEAKSSRDARACGLVRITESSSCLPDASARADLGLDVCDDVDRILGPVLPAAAAARSMLVESSRRADGVRIFELETAVGWKRELARVPDPGEPP